MRTIVIGDAHGYPWVLGNALEHAGFDPAIDRFVFTGDFLDRGPDPQGCLDLIETNADVVLVGNHELAVLLEDPITPFDPASALYESYLRGRVLDEPAPTRWRCAVAIGDVLVTHAGVPARYLRALQDECGGDISRFAEWLNEAFDESLRASRSRQAVDWEGLLGLDGPFWFRPRGLRAVEILPGVTQIAGHTPVPEADARAFAARGFYLIDPYVYDTPGPERYRYAVIESSGDDPPWVWIEDSEAGRIEAPHEPALQRD